MCSTIEIVARMRVIDPKSIRADTFGPMAGDPASISEGIISYNLKKKDLASIDINSLAIMFQC